jgi:hypothetical protein
MEGIRQKKLLQGDPALPPGKKPKKHEAKKADAKKKPQA